MKLKRIYELAAKDDGKRILVDRLWPRGLSKQEARLDLWLKNIGPSPSLRRAFGHDPKKFVEFEQAYLKELYQDKERNTALRQLEEIYAFEKGNITLLYAAKEERYNHAIILQKILLSTCKKR